MSVVTVAPVTSVNWSDLESLFERRGGPRHCYCMVNREMEPKYSRADSPAKRAAIQEYVERGVPVGVLALHGICADVRGVGIRAGRHVRQTPTRDATAGKVISSVRTAAGCPRHRCRLRLAVAGSRSRSQRTLPRRSA